MKLELKKHFILICLLYHITNLNGQFSIEYNWDTSPQGWILEQISWDDFDCIPPYNYDLGLFNNAANQSNPKALSPVLPNSNGCDITIDLLTRWGSNAPPASLTVSLIFYYNAVLDTIPVIQHTLNSSGCYILSGSINGSLIPEGASQMKVLIQANLGNPHYLGFSEILITQSDCVPCTTLQQPQNETENVPIEQDLFWNTVPSASGYVIKVGTTQGGTDIVNNLDVGNVNTYDLGVLPYSTVIYVSIVPYNSNFQAENCIEEWFVTENFVPPFTFSPTNSSGVFLGQAQIDGVPAESGDWVAAFDEENNCAGANEVIIFNSVGYINLTIYGDDPTTIDIDEGINTGESFTLKIYDSSEDIYLIYPYSSTPFNFSEWTNTNGTPMPNYNNPSVIYNFSTARQDEIILNAGWNLISLDVTPENNEIEVVFDELINDGNLVYISGYNNGASFFDPNGLPFLNTLIALEEGFGYWVKVNQLDVLTVTGLPISPDFINPLNANWNLIAYPSLQSSTPEEYFADLIANNNLIFVSGYNQGSTFYDPNGLPFLNTLDSLENGLGYWVKVINATNYSEQNVQLNNRHVFEGSCNYDFYNGKIDIGNEGEFVEIVTRDNIQVGKMQIIEGGYLMTTAVYGQSEKSLNLTKEGDNLLFKYKNRIIDAGIKFKGNKECTFLNLQFAGKSENFEIQCYPNPFDDKLEFRLGTNQAGIYLCCIYDNFGQLNWKQHITFNEDIKVFRTSIDSKNFTAGNYILVVKNLKNSESFYKKIVRIE